MTAFTNFSEDFIVETLLRGQQPAASSVVYLALYTDVIGENGVGPEADYAQYARQAITVAPFDQSSGTTWNENAISFPANGNPVDSIIITHAAIVNAATVGTGEVLIKGQLASPKTLAPNDVLAFAEQALTLGLD